MKIDLPAQLDLTCNMCIGKFKVPAKAISRNMGLYCPFCGEQLALFECLPPRLRREIYFKARRHIELLAQNYTSTSPK